jgi:hypothetical protein
MFPHGLLTIAEGTARIERHHVVIFAMAAMSTQQWRWDG